MPTSNNSDRELKINQVYGQLDRKYEEEETKRKAARNKLPYISLFGFPIDPMALALIPKDEAIGLGLVVFFKEGRNLKLGSYEPSPAADKAADRLRKDGHYVEVYQISKSSLENFLAGYANVQVTARRDDRIKVTGGELDAGKVSSLKELGEKLRLANTTQLIEAIMSAALELDSSDIHLEPEPQGVKVRFRVDGVLQDITYMASASHHNLISRLKLQSKLKLNVTAMPQDGSFSMDFNQSKIDVRVSILPSAFGETVVMRLLRQDKGMLRFEDLGIEGLARERLEKELLKPNGMILTTGPTGSGKTTTLYAILSKLNEPGVKIITLEDPVEYRIPGISQTPIDSNAGLNFATALRAILRQDPDIVMVGEMRDLETAETAAQAASTGHIVLSTLHTNDAAGALPRLLDLGVKPFVLADAINAIIAQRLLRKICQFCKQEQRLEKKIQARVELVLSRIPKAARVQLPPQLKFYHSVGCPKCSGLGYRGRMGVYEVFIMNEHIEKLIQMKASTSEIRNQAVSDGMVSMSQDGILKAASGITDVAEVFRVTED